MSKRDGFSVFLSIALNAAVLIKIGYKFLFDEFFRINISSFDFIMDLIVVFFTAITMVNFCKDYKQNNKFTIPKYLAIFTIFIDFFLLIVSFLLLVSFFVVASDGSIMFMEELEIFNNFIAKYFAFLNVSNCIALYVFDSIFMCFANVFKAIAVTNKE